MGFGVNVNRPLLIGVLVFDSVVNMAGPPPTSLHNTRSKSVIYNKHSASSGNTISQHNTVRINRKT